MIVGSEGMPWLEEGGVADWADGPAGGFGGTGGSGGEGGGISSSSGAELRKGFLLDMGERECCGGQCPGR